MRKVERIHYADISSTFMIEPDVLARVRGRNVKLWMIIADNNSEITAITRHTTVVHDGSLHIILKSLIFISIHMT